jgi:5'(3')-deoxyribonucleotidase
VSGRSAPDLLARIPPERRIYLDLDDVLAETTERIVARLNELFERQVRFEDLSGFDLGDAFRLDPNERARAMHSVHEVDFLDSLAVAHDALPLLRSWAGRGFHLAVITGRPPATRGVSQRWLERCGVPHHSLHTVDKYGRYAGEPADATLDELRALPFALAIEDSLEMASFLVGHGTQRVLLMDRPWNRSLPDALAASGRIERVRDWSEVARCAERALAVV